MADQDNFIQLRRSKAYLQNIPAFNLRYLLILIDNFKLAFYVTFEHFENVLKMQHLFSDNNSRIK